MVRYIIALVHAGFAALLTTSGLWLLAQGRLNTLWESGFYQTVSPPTLVMTAGAIIFLLFSALQLVFGVGYALHNRWGAYGLLVFSGMYAIGFPAPISWLFWTMLIAIAVDLWLSTPAPVEEE